MRAQLSRQRAEALTALLRRITPHNVVTAFSVMQLLGMMSAGHVTVPLGLLHMRRLQRWFIRLRVDPIRQRQRMVSVPPSVGPDLAYWGNPHVLSVGVPLGRNQHVLIRTDNRAAAAYINRQGGVRSAQLLNIARKLLHWAHTHLLSIRAMYIPGKQNRGADIMSRGGPRQGDWSLHLELVKQIWLRFREAEVDLFAARGNTHCALWFSLSSRDDPPLGVDAFAHRPWPMMRLYAFPPVPLIPLREAGSLVGGCAHYSECEGCIHQSILRSEVGGFPALVRGVEFGPHCVHIT
ncbi:hypothetical protein L3Q82_006008 [Scortum barcoo]|uniref:Uncharacterized protein n=1 Tax=Scortum barcoo TaxID=214431 RepID=A0ACB8X269_9TELE|nr:hypothetical protein L3Q82_006008 [Scortum barcoo]